MGEEEEEEKEEREKEKEKKQKKQEDNLFGDLDDEMQIDKIDRIDKEEESEKEKEEEEKEEEETDLFGDLEIKDADKDLDKKEMGNKEKRKSISIYTSILSGTITTVDEATKKANEKREKLSSVLMKMNSFDSRYRYRKIDGIDGIDKDRDGDEGRNRKKKKALLADVYQNL